MAPIKLNTTVWCDSLLPRDGIQINPVVNTTAGVTDSEALVNDWIVAFKGYSPLAATNQITVKAYDVSRPKPNYPLFERTDNPGLVNAAPSVREVALCLSFYAGNNVPRRRGRLYVPMCLVTATSTYPVRPSQTIIDKVAALVPILTALGGVDVDWSVWSGVDGTARAVTDWWIDNEWDIQRRRGLRGTARTLGTTTEESRSERSLV